MAILGDESCKHQPASKRASANMKTSLQLLRSPFFARVASGGLGEKRRTFWVTSGPTSRALPEEGPCARPGVRVGAACGNGRPYWKEITMLITKEATFRSTYVDFWGWRRPCARQQTYIFFRHDRPRRKKRKTWLTEKKKRKTWLTKKKKCKTWLTEKTKKEKHDWPRRKKKTRSVLLKQPKNLQRIEILSAVAGVCFAYKRVRTRGAEEHL
jgi:hypothetical protein